MTGRGLRLSITSTVLLHSLVRSLVNLTTIQDGQHGLRKTDLGR